MNRGILVAAAFSALPFTAWADEQPQPLEAGKENTGRISVVNGQDLFGRGPYDEETWELSINAVVREGDELFTEDGTYAEIELPGGTFLRLDGDTTIVLQRVSEQSVEVALAEGSVYVSRGSNAQPVMVQTFGGAIEMGGNSMARVGTDKNKTQIEVRTAKGSAEMRSEKTAIAVPETKSLVWTRSGSRNDNWSTSTYDDFDRWNQKREDTVRGTSRPANVASNAIGAYELEGQGTWVMIDGYYAWRPTVVVADWRPYSNGYWSWTEPWGWTWVDYYGWGYTTSHYGRWYYRSHHGWVWYPDAYWGGSYVVWAAFGPHIGWAPCDYWGRPIYVYSYYSYYDYGAWCYSDADYFYTGGGYRPRGVRTSTSRTVGGGGSVSRGAVGRSGTHQIRTFTAETIRQHSPVPVRNARAELTPKNIAEAAGRGQIKGVRAEQRGGQFLSRAVKDGGVKPEPWTDRGGRDAFNNGGKSGRTGMTDPSGGRDPGRAAEGWGRGGSSTDANRGGSDPVGGRNGGSSDRGGAWNSNDRNGSSDRGSQPSYDRGGSSNDRGSQPSYDRGGSSNDRGSQPSQPSRGGNDSGSSKSRDSGSQKSTPPPKQDDKKSNDSNKSNDSKPKPRSSWSDTQASSSSGREGWGKRGEKSAAASQPSYNYNGRDTSSSPAPSAKGGYSASSRSNSGSSSYSAPSRGNGGSSSSSAPSYSAPSRSSGSSSAPSYSAPKSSGNNGGGRSYSSGSSNKSSGGSSSKSSSSSGGSRSSSSSSSSSNSSSSSKSNSGKRGR